MAPLELFEALIEEPKAFEVLAEEVGRNGGRCPSREELIRVVRILEGVPLSSIKLGRC